MLRLALKARAGPIKAEYLDFADDVHSDKII